jgi:hypothetical protein
LTIWLSIRSVFHIIVYHYVLFHLTIWLSVRPLFTSINVPIGRGCQRSVSIFLEQFEIEDDTLTSDWLKHFHLLLLNNCRWSHQTCQIWFSILCSTWTIFQNMVVIFYMTIPLYFQLKSVRSVFHIIVYHYVLFHLTIWLSVRPLFTSCGIFKPFLMNQGK